MAKTSSSGEIIVQMSLRNAFFFAMNVSALVAAVMLSRFQVQYGVAVLSTFAVSL